MQQSKKTDDRTTFDFDVEVGKVLNIMINSLYTNKDIALRELVSNASDACDKMRYLGMQKPDLVKDELKINIATNKEKNLLIISDNGLGMDRDDLINNLGTIAKSGTENFMKALTGDKEKDVQLIGQFGVGFYSSFMIANEVEVISKKYDNDKSWLWKSKGSGSFEIKEAAKKDRGTKIILHLKDDAKDFLDRFHIKHVVQTYSDHINFKIDYTPEKTTEGVEPKAETLNAASALWTEEKSKITKEQYESFYKHVSHLPGEPYMTLHNKVEGMISYTNLLFVPSSKPFDLFHPDRRTSVKLYVKKVFISEDLELVPTCMRFLRGVVDSQDLPLNISRENLQHSAVLAKIRKSLIKRVLNDLKKKSEKSEDEYIKFWNNFGAVLKEGLCESTEYRDQIFDICRFYSSKSPDKLISLDQYIKNAKEDQKKIYFLTGENIEKIQSSPQLEIFLKKDVEVIFLTDAVDEFWVTVALPYKEKEFQSINRGDIDLDEDSTKKKDKDEQKSDKKEDDIKDVTNSEFGGLTKYCKEILGDKVKDVRVSKKLTSSPVCLAVDSGAMDIRLERFLLEQKQIQSATAKVFEINPENDIIKKLSKDYTNTAKKLDTDDTIKTLFDLACIIEDETIKDTKDFSRRIVKHLGS